MRRDGDVGTSIFDCHQFAGLASTGPTKTKLTDLAILCANCRRPAHRLMPDMTVAALKARLAASKTQAQE